MSRIRRLSIRGIRNFGDETEESEICFSRPLTLILGSNGTGKTTIIEALKFATCGEFPPGSDGGKFFIHDPVLTTTSSVQGVVKAEISDAASNDFTICRTIEYSKANTSMKFKTLDTTLSRIKKLTNEVTLITNRCTNVDTELTLAMGVSKPILDYVIFCHQENLNWPFQDGRKLKEKFDEIFDSARYNNALENIMKIIKDLRERISILKEQKQNCAYIVKELKDKETKLEDNKKRVENIKIKVEEINEDLEPISQKLKEMEKLECDYKDLLSEEKRKRAKYEMSKVQSERLQKNISQLFEGSLEELEEEYKSYDINLIKKINEIKELETRLKDIVKEESSISKLLADERVINVSLKQQLKEQERKIASRNKLLNGALSSALDVENVDSDVSEIGLVQTVINADAAKEKVLDETRLRNEMEIRLNTIDEDTVTVLKQSSLQAELELNKSALLSKEKEIQKLKEKHEQKLTKLLNITKLPESKLKIKLDTVQKQLMDEIEGINQEIQIAENQSTTLETTITDMKHELEKKMKEIESDKLKIATICYYKHFDEVLLMESKKVKDLQDKRGIYASQGATYREYMRELKQKNPCCPLCHRNFDKDGAVVVLLQDMEKEEKSYLSQLKECDIELKTQQEKYDKMLQLKPLVENIIQFEETELKTTKNNMETFENKLIHSKTFIIELKEKKSETENKLSMCNEIMSDIVLWNNYIDEIDKLKEIINIQKRMSDAGIQRKYRFEQTLAKRQELRASLRKLFKEIETLNASISTDSEKMNDAAEKQSTFDAEKLKIKSNMQKLKQLKGKQEKLLSKEISLGSSLDQLGGKVAATGSELNALSTEADRRLADLTEAQEGTDLFIYLEIPKAIECSESKIKKYQESIDRLIETKNDTESRVNKLKQDINCRDIRKRELYDNILLLKNQEASKKLKKECSIIQVKLSNIHYPRIVEERMELQNREETLLRQKNMMKGNQEELERAVKECTEELRKDIYIEARKNLKSKCIELMVVEETILNLNEYSKVLDAAIIEYHEERMAMVNRIMREMWRLVYTGRDITSIEIRTDTTEGIGSARRTYNYKVVETKHGHEIDMKGRCSAGEKVLASIIIRLALAETFCKNCGVLALDEPTTNLDQENADSLASALAMLVKLRSQHQQNFQLIVISHDEKFLLKLAELNNNEGYYELYRKYNVLKEEEEEEESSDEDAGEC